MVWKKLDLQCEWPISWHWARGSCLVKVDLDYDYCLLEPNHFLLAIVFTIIIRDLKSAWCQHPAKYHIGRCGSDFQSDTMWSGKSSQLWFIVGKIYFYLHYVGKNAPDDWICIFTPNPKKVILFFEPKVVSCLPGEYSKATIANSLLYFVFCWLLQLLV